MGGVRGIILFDRGTEAYFCKFYRELKKFEYFPEGKFEPPPNLHTPNPIPLGSWIDNSDRRSTITLYYIKGSSTKNFIIMITDNEYMKFTVNLAL